MGCANTPHLCPQLYTPCVCLEAVPLVRLHEASRQVHNAIVVQRGPARHEWRRLLSPQYSGCCMLWALQADMQHKQKLGLYMLSALQVGFETGGHRHL